MAEIKENGKNEIVPIEISESQIRNLIYYIRGKYIMLDSDLAHLYQVETSALNRAVKRNILRFPDDFRFELTEEEFLRCQIGISNDEKSGRGGRRYLPFAYTEEGISMLASVLRSDVAIRVSIGIMRSFVELRKMWAGNRILTDRINEIEIKQLEYQKSSDEKFDKIFEYISEHEEDKQVVFFDGKIYDAFSFIVGLIKKATKDIVLVDGYVDVNTLDMLSKKQNGVDIIIITYPGASLSKRDVVTFNTQYPTLTVKKTNIFHDRFIILDGSIVYHIGASVKDAGKKCFAISLIQDTDVAQSVINKVNSIP